MRFILSVVLVVVGCASGPSAPTPQCEGCEGPSGISAGTGKGSDASDDRDVGDGHDPDVETSSVTLPPECTALAHCCLVAPSDDGDPTSCYEQATSGTLTGQQCEALLAAYAAMGMCQT